MRRSSTGALRVRNEPEAQGKPRPRVSSGLNRHSSGTRTSIGSKRSSVSQIPKSHGRPSTAGVPQPKRRNSSRSYGHELKQDPRPITDRRFKERSIREIIEFLIQYGYPHPCSPKILHSPPSKEFIRIFEFMYGQVQPGFKCISKIEDQFPQIMKALGYPFSISKSSLYAIGSPHTWPSLLAALSWLREQIQDMINKDVNQLIFPGTQDDFDAIPMSKVVFMYCDKSYQEFLQGSDNFEDLESQLAKDIRKNSPGGDLEGLIHENRRLEQELNNLQEQADPRIELKDSLATLNLDRDKMLQYLQRFTQHHEQQSAAFTSLEMEIQTFEADLETIHADNTKKRAILDTQTFSQADVQRINLERRALQQQIEVQDEENAAVEKLIWEEERKIAKDQEQIQKKCATYNNIVDVLQVEIGANHAAAVDFKLHHSPEETHSVHFENTIKPSLTRLKNQFMDKVNKLEQDRIMGQNNMTQLNYHISEKQDLVTDLDQKITYAQSELERTKSNDKQGFQRLKTEIDEIQTELNDLHVQGSMDLNDFFRKVEEAKKRYHFLCSKYKKEEKEYSEFAMKAAVLVIDHKTAIQECMDKVVKEAEQELNEEKQNK